MSLRPSVEKLHLHNRKNLKLQHQFLETETRKLVKYWNKFEPFLDPSPDVSSQIALLWAILYTQLPTLYTQEHAIITLTVAMAWESSGMCLGNHEMQESELGAKVKGHIRVGWALPGGAHLYRGRE